MQHAVGISSIPVVLLDVLDDVDASGLEALDEERLKGDQLVFGEVRAVIDDKVQIACGERDDNRGQSSGGYKMYQRGPFVEEASPSLQPYSGRLRRRARGSKASSSPFTLHQPVCGDP